MRTFAAFWLFLIVRIASVFIVKTFFVPDEYWQSLEVAHKLAFGYGHLTWEWKQGLRSFIYPAVFAGVYKILALFNWDTVELLVFAPRILQAILSAYADYRVYIWTGRKKWAAFMIVVPYFWFYSASRTLTNTLETDLTAIALSYFPWEGERTHFIWIAALCCYLRPTSAVIWATLCLYHLRKTKYSAWDIILKRYCIIGAVVLSAGTAIDSYFYGRLTVPPWEFLKLNVFKNVGVHYGTHQWHWYLIAGVPIALGSNTLPFLAGAIQTIRHRRVFPVQMTLLTTIAVYLVVLSCLQHKEVRFVLILMPMVFYICAAALSRWSRKASRTWLWMTASALLILNALPAWYISTIHQRGTLDVMPHLESIAVEYKDHHNPDFRPKFLFLMPCHSTPFYSHIHQNITMRFLTCEPNTNEKPNYMDETDQFYSAPDYWLRSHLPSYPLTALPTHVIMFDSLKDKIPDFLREYNLKHTVPHAEISLTGRIGKNVLVYERHDLVERPWEEEEPKAIEEEYQTYDQDIEDL